MKKFLTILMGLVIAFTTMALTACSSCAEKGDEQKLSLYTPDGAPALSVARLLDDKSIIPEIDINVIDAQTIQGYVGGTNPTADFAILPVNLASKILGNAKNYKMLGVVTNGNLFLMKKQGGQDITAENISTVLIGKKVGVINLGNVPGLTFKAILNDYEIPFVESSQSQYQSDKVNLVALTDGTEVVPTSDCDYFVVPEPAASTKNSVTQGKLSFAGSLQVLYGDGNGYPQAVLVAKKSVIADNKEVVDKLVASFAQNKQWLLDENTTSNTILNAIKSGYTDDLTPAFNANFLTKQVISNCAVDFNSASIKKQAVLDYMNKINAVSVGFGLPTDEFFAE